ncbi:D-alanyl-D-alanine carboxypeptidase family protein [Candidatus Liberibacter americanus]|nr:D-alanyl-D-alanine carboxypeptidase family protein [Candidatus Liberibacter americanus]
MLQKEVNLLEKKYFLENIILYAKIFIQNLMKIFSIISFLIILITTKLHAKPTKASIVINIQNGKTVYGFKQNEKNHPASLTKMMTLYIVFEHLQSKKIKLSTKIPVSKNAAMQPASKLYLKENTYFTVEQGILALVTRSANDVSTAFGEFFSGSERKFAILMSNKAKSLGMHNTIYKNSSGLHDKEQVTTAYDQAILGASLRRNLPEYYKYFSKKQFRYKNRIITNHNNLLNKINGIDGIKTGYTQESGYNIVTSLKSDDESIIAVVMGMPTNQGRDKKALELICLFKNKKNIQRNKNIKKSYSPISKRIKHTIIKTKNSPIQKYTSTIPAIKKDKLVLQEKLSPIQRINSIPYARKLNSKSLH